MFESDNYEIEKSRYQKVVKHNDLVQKSRYALSVSEQKAVSFLVSLIKPEDKIILEYEFEILDYCRICGIDTNQGVNYSAVRTTLKALRDKSIYLGLSSGIEVTVSWVAKVWLNRRDGTVKVRFDEDLAPYLFNLHENTTRYELLNILPMKSKYSIRIYEICRSWAGIKSKTYSLEDLRNILEIPVHILARYNDFKRRVLEQSKEEINKFTDLEIYFEELKRGNKIVKIRIHINIKEYLEKIEASVEGSYILENK